MTINLANEAGARLWIEDLKRDLRHTFLSVGHLNPVVVLLGKRDIETGKVLPKPRLNHYHLDKSIADAGTEAFGFLRMQAKLCEAFAYAFCGQDYQDRRISLHVEHDALGIEEFFAPIIKSRRGTPRLQPWDGGPVEAPHRILSDAREWAAKETIFQSLKASCENLTPQQRYMVAFTAVDEQVQEGKLSADEARCAFNFIVESLRNEGLEVGRSGRGGGAEARAQ